MSDCCYHDVQVTGDEELMAEVGRCVDARWLSAAKEMVVIGQNVQLKYETKGVRLAEVERIAFEFPATRVFHMYQEPAAQIRGIAIYESGRRTSLRHMEGVRFLVDDWLSFPTSVEVVKDGQK